jgi:hypothetical protein
MQMEFNFNGKCLPLCIFHGCGRIMLHASSWHSLAALMPVIGSSMVDEGENQVEGFSKTPPLEVHAKCLAHIVTGPVHQFRIKIAPFWPAIDTLFFFLERWH